MKNLNIIKWALILSIVIVLNLFINFSVEMVYDRPEWDEFCVEKQVNIIPDTQEKCVEAGGSWTENRILEPGPKNVTGSCNTYFTCQQEYNDARTLYDRNVFIILVVAGVAALGVGFFTTSFSAVSLGFSFGGVLSLVIAAIRYWSNMDDYLRVIVLGVALAVLIWFGVKKIKDQ